MEPDERAALKSAYPEHAFLRVQHPLGEAIIAIPRKQSSEEKAAAVELWHGATAKISAEQSCARQRQRAEKSAPSS